ncbi:MAG: hypothetical protein QOE86_4012, partial [Solirubrobacteraceae bacterium]|nr:hypothetical protein [Solirubrobacteraceae bacterium]
MSTSQRADSELREELRRLRALADATAALGASADFDESLHTMARLLVPAVADWCFVELLQPDGSIERRVIQAADPAKHELAHRFNERFPLDPDAPVGSPAVIRSGEPELTPEIPAAFLEAAAADAEHLEFLRAFSFRSSMVVPLRIGGEVVGDLALAQAESGRLFGPDDLAYVTDLAARCSLLLEVQRRAASERAAREELEAILEGVADAVIAQGPDGEIVFANQAAVELVGLGTADDFYAGG